MTDARPLAGPLLVSAVVALLVAGAGGAATDLGPWYRDLVKPSWQPPDFLFGPAWTLIFALCAITAAQCWRRTADPAARRRLLAAFVVNGALNIAWSVLFFHLQRPAWALAEVALLWLSILVLAKVCAGIWRPSRWLLAPYLAWVSFAAVLNAAIVRLNPS